MVLLFYFVLLLVFSFSFCNFVPVKTNRMKRIVSLLFLAGFLALSSEAAYAQRLIPGQSVISVSGDAWMQYGGEIGWERMFYSGKSVIRLNFLGANKDSFHFDATDEMPEANFAYKTVDYLVSGGYLWRVASNRSRSVNFWLGGTVDLGARTYKIAGETEGYNVPNCKFLYCFSPQIELETFVSKALAFDFTFKPRIQLYGHKVFDRVFYPNFSIGLNYYFLIK